ncbi:MAG: hypothetical protein ABF285_07420 [Pacificibacter sp.]
MSRFVICIVLCAAVSGCGVARIGVKTGAKVSKAAGKMTANVIN